LGAWTTLDGAAATALAMDGGGDIAAEFPGYGVWQYMSGAGWSSLVGTNAALLAAANGAVAAAFPGYGVWEHDPARGWFQLISADATLLAF
jgi:hypothetical protein